MSKTVDSPARRVRRPLAAYLHIMPLPVPTSAQ
jgi:hypothetical protein